MRALRYFLDEALASLGRGYRTGIVAVGTIAVALFVLGGFLVVTSNLERLFDRWQEAAEFSIYLHDDVADEERAIIERTLRASGLVSSLEFVSKEQALGRFRQNFKELAAAAGELPENPLPASVEVRLRPDAAPAAVETLALQSAMLPGVADVRYDRQWIQRLMGAVALVRTGGLALAAVLIIAAALTVASVVRLTLVVRRDEIHIMQLVGAPLAYIRGPFVIEGLIQGGAGALLAVVLLWGAFTLVRLRYGAVLAEAIEPGSLVFLSFTACGGLLAGGMAVGCIGGLVAARSTRETDEQIR
jgi:cell division transport system permease protein